MVSDELVPKVWR
jgi:hypothetical protein